MQFGMLKTHWIRIKKITAMYIGTFVVIMILNQLLFFGFCLKPVCLIAAVPHVFFISAIIGTWFNKLTGWGENKKEDVKSDLENNFSDSMLIQINAILLRKEINLTTPIKSNTEERSESVQSENILTNKPNIIIQPNINPPIFTKNLPNTINQKNTQSKIKHTTNISTEIAVSDKKSDIPECIERTANQLGAVYSPSHKQARYNLHADEHSVKAYLGTYLPRTVFEFMTIGQDMLNHIPMLKAVPTHRPLRILDLGSGTGGAWMGLASALFANNYRQALRIYAVDGNRLALAKQAPFARAMSVDTGVDIQLITTQCTIGSDAASFSQDLVALLERLNKQYDFVLVSKYLSEFYCAAGQAAHGVVHEALHLLAPALTPKGFLVILDVTTRIDEVGEYFPNLMARELGQYMSQDPESLRPVLPVPCAINSASGCDANGGKCFTQRQMHFSHAINRSGLVRSESTKVTYRVLTHPTNAHHISAGYSVNLTYQVNAQRDDQACHRGQIVSHMRGVNGYLPNRTARP